MQNPTTNDYPKEASFVLEYNHGHIPQMVFQTSHKEDYRMFLEKHMGITRAKDPVLKFINNEWATTTKMHKYFNSNPKCPMCNSEENLEHVFSCNSTKAKMIHHETLKSIKKVLSKNNQDLTQWWCTK